MRPRFEVLDAVVNLETRQLTHEALLGVMARHPDLVGVYCAGGGMEGAIAALREAGVGERIACLVHELTPESRQALLERYISGVFQTPLKELCADLMATVVHTIEQGDGGKPRAALCRALSADPGKYLMVFHHMLDDFLS